MKLPSGMVDLSSPLDNDTVYDPPIMRPGGGAARLAGLVDAARITI